MVIMDISKKYFLPSKVEYYDEDNILVRVLNYKDINKLKNNLY